MASEWESMKIGEFASVKGGKRLPLGSSLVESPTPHPYIRIVDLVDGRVSRSGIQYVPIETQSAISRYTVDAGDVIVSIVGSVGLVAIVPDKLHKANLTENAAKILIDNKIIDNSFLAYYLKSSLGQNEIFKNTVGAVQLKLPLYGIENIEVPIPPLPTQKAIAHILGTLDDKIELLRSMNETLEAMARALFKSWFIDFDPVRKKAAGEPTRLPIDIDSLFPDSFEDSELGEIPKGWTVTEIGQFCSVINEQVFPDSMKDSVCYVGLEHVPKKSIALSEWGTSDDLQSNKAKFKAKDILFGKLRPYFHKVVFAPKDGICSTDILVIRPKKTSYWGYALMHLSSEAMVERATAFSNGTKMPRAKWSDLQSYLVVEPTQKLISFYNEAVLPQLESITCNVEEVKYLSTMRDSLLPKLISGDLELSEKQISQISEHVK